MVLRDASGLVVDSLNYGGLVDPWAAEGYQAHLRIRAEWLPRACARCGRGFGRPLRPQAPNRSAGRFPGRRDTDSNCTDFLTAGRRHSVGCFVRRRDQYQSRQRGRF